MFKNKIETILSSYDINSVKELHKIIKYSKSLKCQNLNDIVDSELIDLCFRFFGNGQFEEWWSENILPDNNKELTGIIDFNQGLICLGSNLGGDGCLIYTDKCDFNYWRVINEEPFIMFSKYGKYIGINEGELIVLKDQEVSLKKFEEFHIY